ncbi:MAG: SPW repeat protein [Anaerolineae bacterium]|nr:SPW repeat protein [Anaerolineae bacterium]
MFWITAVVGLVLASAPWLLGYADHVAARWAGVLLGLVVFVISISGLLAKPTRERWEYWAFALLTLGLIAAPVVLGYSNHTEPAWTAILLGGVLVMVNSVQLFRVRLG